MKMPGTNQILSMFGFTAALGCATALCAAEKIDGSNYVTIVVAIIAIPVALVTNSMLIKRAELSSKRQDSRPE